MEAGGGVHRDQVEYDPERDRMLKGRDLRIIRFTNQQIRDGIAKVIERIAVVCGDSAGDRKAM